MKKVGKNESLGANILMFPIGTWVHRQKGGNWKIEIRKLLGKRLFPDAG
jgi:hypothetical protein